MTTTISDGTTTLTPQLQIGYVVSRRSRNVVHRILNSQAPAVSLRPGALRSGRHSLLFTDEATALAAVAMLASDRELTLEDTERPDVVNMTFVVPSGGDVQLELDSVTRRNWVVQFDFEETD